MQSIINYLYPTLTVVEVYFSKSVYTINESDVWIFIDVMASRRYYTDKFSVETKPFVNKTLKPYYGNCLII